MPGEKVLPAGPADAAGARDATAAASSRRSRGATSSPSRRAGRRGAAAAAPSSSRSPTASPSTWSRRTRCRSWRRAAGGARRQRGGSGAEARPGRIHARRCSTRAPTKRDALAIARDLEALGARRRTGTRRDGSTCRRARSSRTPPRPSRSSPTSRSPPIVPRERGRAGPQRPAHRAPPGARLTRSSIALHA